MKRDEIAVAPQAAPSVGECTTRAVQDPLDSAIRAELAGLTGGISVASLALATLDWALHLAVSPGKIGQATSQWLRQNADDIVHFPLRGETAPVAGDPRFAAPGWQQWPFCCVRDAFLHYETWWETLTGDIDGVSPHHQRLAAFCARQWLDLGAPSNIWWLNPAVLQAAGQTMGANFVRGAGHWLEDLRDTIGRVSHEPPERRPPAFVVGHDVAVTPGKIVYRNALFELIQYAPVTVDVWREPVLIVPSWIMKYYILDLQPHDSLVRYLVSHGHTVYMMSWKNPGAEARDRGMDDYLQQGLMTALRVVHERSDHAAIHAAGYCLGGTLLAIAAAALARDAGGAPLRTVTLFATETDYRERGELGLFIDDSALSTLDALMRRQGYLDGPQLAAAFQMLNARDLVWSRFMGEYLLGERARPNDLIAWNRDTTRLPFRLHSECLHRLFLENELAEARYCVDDRPIALSDIATPMFMVGTEHDHVSPWRSVYKLLSLTRNALTFLLTSGGHNAGIVSEPGHARRRFRVRTREPGSGYRGPDSFLAEAQQHEGSWWPCWQDWLATQSSERRPPPDPAIGALGDAPGPYVKES